MFFQKGNNLWEWPTKFEVLINTLMIIGVFLSTASCGTFEEEKQEIAPSFNELLDRFIEEAQIRGYQVNSKHLVMRFGEIDQSDRQIAICITYISQNPIQEIAKVRSDWKKVFGPGKAPEVVIPDENWQLLSETQREITVFHELGHCLLGLSHTDDKQAIMNTHIMSSRYYRAHRGRLIDELFDAFRSRKVY